MIGFTAERLMALEVEGEAPGTATLADRTRDRSWETRAGTAS